MASKKTGRKDIDLAAAFSSASAQFRDLNTREPGQWPILPKMAAWSVAAAVVVVFGWVLLLSDTTDQLEAARNQEPQLKDEYRDKYGQAVNLEELRKQREQVQEYVTQLEKQLPGKAEMDALLSDINQAGIGRGLQFDLFRPGQVVLKDYYAELPISIKVEGRFHDIGAFAADVANLSRIVTLHELSISPKKSGDGDLEMEATARTYRYLDADEVAEIRRSAAARKGNAKAK